MSKYCCLDCGLPFNTAEAMNDHIDAEHNEGYGGGPGGQFSLLGYPQRDEPNDPAGDITSDGRMGS